MMTITTAEYVELTEALAAALGPVGEAEVGFALAAELALGAMLAITLIRNVPLNR